jgi:hypothetical protein
MGAVNLSETEKSAIASIDERELGALIDQAIRDEQLGDLPKLPLSNCGLYVSSKLHRFREALSRYGQAKAAKKRSETKYSVEKAGRDLSFAVGQMKSRLEEETKDGEPFYVYDQIHWPSRFSADLTVRVSYRWRRSVDEDWKHGSITFAHKVVSRPDFSRPTPKRKPSVTEQAQDLQDHLARTWESFMQSSLWAVRDYFKDGGDGALIPEKFQAIPDSHTGGLNNFSTQFWPRKA